MANYKCEQCGQEFEHHIKLFWHKKKTHGITETPTLSDVGMKEVIEAKKDENEMPLPPPIEKYVKQIFAGWLDKLEIKNIWKEDCGGYAIEIRVPKEMSTQWKKQPQFVFEKDKDGKDTTIIVETKYVDVPDVRTIALAGRTIDDVKKWLDLVKKHILENSQKLGIILPPIDLYGTQSVQPSINRSYPTNVFTNPTEYKQLA